MAEYIDNGTEVVNVGDTIHIDIRVNHDEFIRKGDMLALFKDYNSRDYNMVASKLGDIPPITKIVLGNDKVQEKLDLAEKILELNKRIARLDDSIRQIGNDEKTKTGSMVITCDCVMPYVDIDVDDVKSMLRTYRDNLRIKMDTLWKEFSTIDLGKEEKQ